MDALRIVLADDHTLFRQGLRRVLEEQAGWHVVAEANDGAEAVRLTLEQEPHIVILDVAMRDRTHQQNWIGKGMLQANLQGGQTVSHAIWYFLRT